MTRTLTLGIALISLLSLRAQGLGILPYITHATCGGSTGSITVYATGGEWPYTYLWSTGETANSVLNVPVGTYSVTVTDNQGATITEDLEILATNALLIPTGPAAPIWTCDEPCSSWIYIYNSGIGGVGPYTVTFDPPGPTGNVNGSFYLNGLCAGNTYTATITDSQGCTGQYGPIVVEPAPEPSIIDSSTTASCPDGATGSMTVEFDQYDSLFITGPGGFWAMPVTNPFTLTNLAPGTYYLQYTILETGQSPGVYSPTCYYTDSIVIPATAEPCGTLNGSVFADLDDDCAQDGNEPGLPYRVMSVEPGGHLLMSGADGAFSTQYFHGTYALDAAVDQYEQNCVTLPAPFTLDANNPIVTIDLPFAPSFGPDLSVHLYLGPHVPGMLAGYTMHVSNPGPYTFTNVVLDLYMDPMLTFGSTSNAPILNEPGHLRFSIASLPGFSHEHITVQMNVPPDGNLIGILVNGSAAAVANETEADLTNNTSSMDRTITGSYDPNDKLGLTSSRANRSSYYLDQDSWVDYTIRFQNTGTGPAYNVYLLDTVSPLLDLTSFQILGATHAFQASLDDPRVLRFDFPNILLPDSGFDMAGSQGHISFRLKPVAGLVPGDELVNAADIFFDFNEPVRTNDAVLLVEQSAGVAETLTEAAWLRPNPTQDQLWLDLPGMQRFDVLSTDGRVMLTGRVAAGSAVNVQQLAPGTYVVRAIGTDGLIQHARLVKR